MLNSRDPNDEFLIDVRIRINPNLWINLKKEIDKLRTKHPRTLSEIETLMLEADKYLGIDLDSLVLQTKEDLPLQVFERRRGWDLLDKRVATIHHSDQ